MDSAMRVGSIVVLAIAAGCGEPAPVPTIPVVGRDAAASSTVRFADGATLAIVAIDPEPIDPEADVHLALQGQGEGGQWTVAIWPPRVGGRQVVLGSGVTPEDAKRPDDPRVVATMIEGGATDAVLRLPAPWHPRTAMITAQRIVDGDAVAAIDGPRTHDGLGVLALVRVQTRPPRVAAVHASTAPIVDGAIDEAVWTSASWVELGDSLDGEPQQPRSAVAFAWDDAALYVAADFVDDDVWSSHRDQDDPIWKEEAFELFVLGAADRGRYLELQVSPHGVTFDARFASHRKGDEAWDGTWTAAAAVAGTLDVRTDRDRGWTVELAVPWSEICANTQTECPPRAGATTRVNAFRLDRPRRGPALAWALAPTREPDFHAPENAAILELSP